MAARPSTTDTSVGAHARARNSLRLQLWSDDAFAHRWLCHEGHACADGCDATAEPRRLALYASDIEVDGARVLAEGTVGNG